MATTDDTPGGILEHCECCDTETVHDVSIQIRTESLKEENAQFSREPYRIRECLSCGERTSQRMNNA